MSTLNKLRSVADSLLQEKKYDQAYIIYDEVNNQIWSAIGNVQQGLQDFSRGYLTHNVLSGIDFRKTYITHASTSLFIKWFNLDSDQVLNEFVFSLNGYLKCITNSKNLFQNFSSQFILNQFVILYTLVINNGDEKWINSLLKYSSPLMENNRLSKVRPNFQLDRLTSYLLDMAVKLKTTDWNDVNFLLLDYLQVTEGKTSKFYKDLKTVSGAKAGYSKQEEKHERYEKYERYERYEKYERYERKSSSSSEREFDSRAATDAQKAKYFGKILGLKGIVTKAHIREQYLKLISQYHPDKVHGLGEELRNVAEEKSKLINEAYEWLKSKYKI